VEQLFDRYVLGQARQALGLGQGQLATFAPRLQHLQQVRRRAARQRQILLRALNDLTRSGAADDTTLSSKLSEIDQQAASAEQQIRDAHQQVEQVLSVDQRARFLVFEQRMERQKLQLIARARAQAAQQAPATRP
jgi:hypothetical protein